MAKRERIAWRVPITIADERVVTVYAATAQEARERAREGHIVRLGRTVKRGILIVGIPERSS